MAPISIAGVSSGGFEILGAGRRIENLENHVGVVTIRSGVSDKIRYGQVFEGRADLDFQAIACVDGRSKITARFRHDSDQPGEIRLFAEDSPAPFSRGSRISNFVTCERDYQLEAQRRFRFGSQGGVLSETGPIWIPLASTDILVRVYFNSRFHGLSVITPSVETLLKLFNISNIATLYGTQ